MRWFKCLTPDHPVMTPIYSDLGAEGYGHACIVLYEASSQEVFDITITHLKRWLNIRTPKAEVLLPYCSTILKYYSGLLNNPTGLLSNSEVLLSNSSVTEASNPRGSIKEEREKEREIERKILEPHIIPDDFAIDDGMLEWCRKKYGSVPDWLEADLPEFIGYWKSKGTMRAGWTRTWQKHIDHCMAYEKEPKSPARISDNWHEPVRGAI